MPQNIYTFGLTNSRSLYRPPPHKLINVIDRSGPVVKDPGRKNISLKGILHPGLQSYMDNSIQSQAVQRQDGIIIYLLQRMIPQSYVLNKKHTKKKKKTQLAIFVLIPPPFNCQKDQNYSARAVADSLCFTKCPNKLLWAINHDSKFKNIPSQRSRTIPWFMPSIQHRPGRNIYILNQVLNSRGWLFPLVKRDRGG